MLRYHHRALLLFILLPFARFCILFSLLMLPFCFLYIPISNNFPSNLMIYSFPYINEWAKDGCRYLSIHSSFSSHFTCSWHLAHEMECFFFFEYEKLIEETSRKIKIGANLRRWQFQVSYFVLWCLFYIFSFFSCMPSRPTSENS